MAIQEQFRELSDVYTTQNLNPLSVIEKLQKIVGDKKISLAYTTRYARDHESETEDEVVLVRQDVLANVAVVTDKLIFDFLVGSDLVSYNVFPLSDLSGISVSLEGNYVSMRVGLSLVFLEIEIIDIMKNKSKLHSFAESLTEHLWG